jgi:glycosyltransferase involved in cell wall biosynthesis
LGNASAVKTYVDFPKVLGINNAVYPLSWDKWKTKDFEAGRRHFLFFSGRGHLHKGLDIVLEAFLKTDLHLHVCQHQESDFMSVYRDDLKKAPNIKFYGAIKMRSPQFESLALKCDWVISATCAEGQPGAILECMAYGLLPIIPEAANIDVDPRWGHLLSDCQISTVREAIQNASRIPSSEIKEKSHLLTEVTRDKYSADEFRGNFKNALSDICKG